MFAAPRVLPVVLLDAPLMLYRAAWYQEGSLLDPDRFSPIAYWADFMNAGGNGPRELREEDYAGFH